MTGANVDPEVDAYIERSEQWPDEMTALRPILQAAGLTEAIKWGKPCYSHDGKNVAIIQEMKDFLALMFFKGALLDDATGVLREQGPNSRSARRIEFTSAEEVSDLADTITAYLREAIAVEVAGIEVGPPPQLVLVEELRRHLEQDPALEAAFESLTPGRRREYNLYFSDAKRAETRIARIDKHAERIKAGKGLRDR
jgi:uncharacterized protein YdeI (YjbR/CyaY-like superfamily)